MWHETWELLIAGLGSAIAIIIATFAIVQARASETQATSTKIQTDLLQKEFTTSHRPWIGPDDGFVNDKIKFGLKFKYKNFGSTPALLVKERWGVTVELPQRKIILDDVNNITDSSVTLPEQKREFSFIIDENMARDADNHKSKLHIWVIIDYEFGDKQQGQYGIIAEYVNKGDTIVQLDTRDEWVK